MSVLIGNFTGYSKLREHPDAKKKVNVLSKEQFEEEYAKKSGVTIDWLRDNGLRVVFCNCGEAGCKGWQMRTAGDVLP